jgi:replicative DNA helicase Mcm
VRFVADPAPRGAINLPPTLLSRFDLILVIMDVPDAERDQHLAEAILAQHQRAEGREASRHQGATLPPGLGSGLFSQEFLRKYVAYAKQRVFPTMDQEAYDRLKDYYTGMRRLAVRQSESEAPRPIPVTPRQLEALIRLTEASARSRLSALATREDAERAVAVVDHFLRRVATVEGGQLDIDTIYTGVSSGHRDRLVRVRRLLMALQSANPQGFSLTQVGQAAREHDLSEAEVERLVGELERLNEVYSPRPGVYKMAT